MVIDVPNENGIMKFQLQDILYLLEVAYTLVSVGHLDEDGFLVTFGGRRCTTRDVNKEVIGVVSKMATRVYKVEHEDIASGVEEHLTLDTLHCHLGHISLEMARKLVKERMITVLELSQLEHYKYLNLNNKFHYHYLEQYKSR